MFLIVHPRSKQLDLGFVWCFPLFFQNVLHDVPDFEERKKLLESLKNRLEALLSPRLMAAFNGHTLGKWA